MQRTAQHSETAAQQHGAAKRSESRAAAQRSTATDRDKQQQCNAAGRGVYLSLTASAGLPLLAMLPLRVRIAFCPSLLCPR